MSYYSVRYLYAFYSVIAMNYSVTTVQSKEKLFRDEGFKQPRNLT